MTFPDLFAKRGLVLRQLWSLLLVLIASSLVMTATVHAREIPGQVTIECSGTVHADGDADQSQGDLDKGMPHHHGTCHGQSLNLPTSDGMALIVRPAGLRPIPSDRTVPASRPVDPALRPPTA